VSLQRVYNVGVGTMNDIQLTKIPQQSLMFLSRHMWTRSRTACLMHD